MSATRPSPTELAEYVRRYSDAVAPVQSALAGASDADLDRKADDPDAWSARQVVHHLADSETNSYVRLRRLIAEPAGTTIAGYDEAHWADVLVYERPITASLAVFVAVRASSLELLETMLPTLPDEVWDRVGQHTESGPYTLHDWLRIYADHGEAHAAQIERALRGEA
jgi:hypothetical protein